MKWETRWKLPLGFAAVPVGWAWEATVVSSDTDGVEKENERLLCSYPTAPVLWMCVTCASDERMLRHTAILPGSSREFTVQGDFVPRSAAVRA